MLVVHWAPHNRTGLILQNGIRPSNRKVAPKRKVKGVWVYPFSRNKTQIGNWRRNLKTWHNLKGNFNGFVFRLEDDDFPLYAGYWFSTRFLSLENMKINSQSELAEKYGDFFSGEVVQTEYNWEDFELILPQNIDPARIIRVLKDRQPKRKRTEREK